MALSWTLDKLGPMCRTADDCGLVLAAIAGRDAADPTTASRRFVWERARNDKQKFRIAVLQRSTEPSQPAVRENFEASLKILGTFCEIAEPVALPDLPFGPVVGTIVDAEGTSAFRDLIESGRMRELRSPNLHWAGCASSMVLAVDYLQAMRVRVKMRKSLEELFGRYDAVVAPARTTVAYPIQPEFSRAYPGMRGGPPLIPAGNIAGQPALSIPNGFGANGLPTGIQFTGKMWSEDKLLAIAAAYQRATDWHTRRPEIRLNEQ